MARAVQKNSIGTQERSRKTVKVHDKLLQSTSRIGKSRTRSNPQATIKSHSSTMMRPVTHLAAGITVPIPKALKSQFGVGGSPLDGAILHSAELLQSVISAGIDNEWLTVNEVDDLLSNYSYASPEQSQQCFILANKVIDQIENETTEFNNETLRCLSTIKSISESDNLDSLKSNVGDWEISFYAGCYEEHQIEEFNVVSNGLIAPETGVCVMLSDLYSLANANDKVTIDIIQFIQFCCDLSNHASSLDLILDDMTKWMAIGELSDIDSKDEKYLTEVCDNYEKFISYLRKLFGDDLEENLFVSPETLIDYYKSHSLATKLYKKIKCFTKENVSDYYKKIKKSKKTPDWLITATELLLSKCHWDIVPNQNIFHTGHIPFEFTKPYGFGFPIEDQIYESLHQHFMYGEEEPVTVCVPFCQETSRILANLDLGETLLLLANKMLFNESEL